MKKTEVSSIFLELNIKKISCLVVILLILIASVMFKTQIFQTPFDYSDTYDIQKDKDNHDTTRFSVTPETNDLILELPDKVYTFSDQFTLTFEDLYLESDILYYIYIELVSPHNVSLMKISIQDPGGNHEFHIFESEMFFEPEFGRNFEIPFGTAKSGGYDITFYSESTDNFNLYIKMDQGPKCLYDKIESSSEDDVIFYEVITFDDGQKESEDIVLETDIMYNFYIGRVSSISITESNIVHLDYIIEDPEGVNFTIYSNELLENIEGVTKFSFGTAIEGDYEIRLKIYCDVEHVNIAYMVIKDYQISQVADVNETKSPRDSDSDEANIMEDLQNNLVMMPIEWVIASICFIGSLGAITYLMIIRGRRRGNLGLRAK